MQAVGLWSIKIALPPHMFKNNPILLFEAIGRHENGYGLKSQRRYYPPSNWLMAPREAVDGEVGQEALEPIDAVHDALHYHASEMFSKAPYNCRKQPAVYVKRR